MNLSAHRQRSQYRKSRREQELFFLLKGKGYIQTVFLLKVAYLRGGRVDFYRSGSRKDIDGMPGFALEVEKRAKCTLKKILIWALYLWKKITQSTLQCCSDLGGRGVNPNENLIPQVQHQSFTLYVFQFLYILFWKLWNLHQYCWYLVSGMLYEPLDLWFKINIFFIISFS